MGEHRPRLQVRIQDKLDASELAQIKQAGLAGLAPVESWSAGGTNRQNAYATHGLFRYFGKFPPPVASYLIHEYTRPGELVSDPMCGSATTGVECLLEDRACELRDVNPLSLLLARVKTSRVPAKSLSDAMDRVSKRYHPMEHGFEPVGLRDVSHWFLPQTQKSLRGLKAAVESEARSDIRDVFTAIFASCVRRVSKATTQQGRLFLDEHTALDDAWPVFERKARTVLSAIAHLPSKKLRPRVEQKDIRESVDGTLRSSASLVIVHPPYFNAYRYSRINSLELAWLGFESKQVRPSELREYFKVGKEENLDRYLDDMQLALTNAAQQVRPGGVLALMIGDTILHARHLQVVAPLLQRISEGPLVLEKIAIRVPRYSEAFWVASQRRSREGLGVALCDYVLVMRKDKGMKNA